MRDHPDEACGIVAGPVGSDQPTRHVPMDNAARSMTFYEFDSQEYLRVWNELDDRDEEAVIIYHSHTATEAYPRERTLTSRAGRGALPARLDPGSGGHRGPFVPHRGRGGDRRAGAIDHATVDAMAVQTYKFGQSPSSVDYECRT